MPYNGASRDPSFAPIGSLACVTLAPMNVLVVGAGGVGAAFAAIVQRRPVERLRELGYPHGSVELAP